MILVDSSVWVDYFNGVSTRETDLLDGYLGTEPLLTGDLILTEVLQGFRSDRDFRRAKRALETLTFEPMVGREIAVASAQNYRKLRASGVTVRKTIDVIIATFCIKGGHRLLHSDRDFTLMETSLRLPTV
ncbi:MAG: PIN domain nuclease [Rhodospirillales bacterium]|nr:PIN domain nuclease [Rhodospirillales bacterium]